MNTEPELGKIADQRSNFNNPFSPVIPSDTVGAIILGVLALILLLALLGSQARQRKLLRKLVEAYASAEA